MNDSPVARAPGGGRKATGVQQATIQRNMAEAAVYGSQIIRDYLRGLDTKRKRVKPISNTKLQAAVKAIEHAIGLPKAKIELKTDALTMRDIAEMAAAFNDNSADNAQEVTQSPGNSLDNIPVVVVPTKPLTARQIKERARN